MENTLETAKTWLSHWGNRFPNPVASWVWPEDCDGGMQHLFPRSAERNYDVTIDLQETQLLVVVHSFDEDDRRQEETHLLVVFDEALYEVDRQSVSFPEFEEALEEVLDLIA